MSELLTPITLRSLTVRNRMWVSPMCQYSSIEGMPTDWHLVHLGSRAVGGAGLVMMEATAVSPEGRISPWDMGLWSTDHAAAMRRITTFIRETGATPAIQLAHAGRKASTGRPWEGGRPLRPDEGGWEPIGPSSIPFDDDHATPREMSRQDIQRVTDAFVQSARLSEQAGFEAIELHFAHGYLVHEFLSGLSNNRLDEYGGSLENRMRLALEITEAVREVWPAHLPLMARLSATDWVEADDAWDLPQSVRLSKELKAHGVDLIDCSSGGLVPHARIKVGPGYQVPFAETIRREAGVATGAVGMITDAHQAEAIIADGKADAVLIARSMLYDPHWALHAAEALREQVSWPVQYAAAAPRPPLIESPESEGD